MELGCSGQSGPRGSQRTGLDHGHADTLFSRRLVSASGPVRLRGIGNRRPVQNGRLGAVSASGRGTRARTARANKSAPRCLNRTRISAAGKPDKQGFSTGAGFGRDPVQWRSAPMLFIVGEGTRVGGRLQTAVVVGIVESAQPVNVR